MDDLERRLVTIERKINIALNAGAYTLALVTGFAVYFLTREDHSSLAPYIGLAAGVFTGGLIQYEARRVEKIFPQDSN
jgi:hypothetical protein